jgi:hypothetical protein
MGSPAHDALLPTSCTIVDYYDDRELTREGDQRQVSGTATNEQTGRSLRACCAT